MTEKIKHQHRAPYTVVIDTTVLEQSKTGTAVYVNNLIKAIDEIHPEDLCILPVKGPRRRCQNITLFRAVNFLVELFWLHIRLPLFLKRHKVDLLHMPAITAPIYSPCPVVVTIHDAHFMTHPQERDRVWMTYIRIAIKITIKKANLILTISNYAADDIEKILKAKSERIRVVHLGVSSRNILLLDENFGLDFEPFLLFVGSTMFHKNVHTLVEAFALLVQDSPFSRYNLVICGVAAEGHSRVLDAISRNALEDKVHFIGFVSESRLSALYKNAALFVFPSKAEGFGLPPLEAMSQGTAVAASDASCIPEILGAAADYFDPDDPIAMKNTISHLLTDETHRRKQIEVGLSHASLFSWAACAAQTLDVYREALRLSPRES